MITSEHGTFLLLLRPDYVVLPSGRLEPGIEIEILHGRISKVQPWTSERRKESGLILSPAFVNAHSHLEYYDLKGQLDGLPYWPWIRRLTSLINERDTIEVQKKAIEAASLNVITGVAAIGEHCNWTVSGPAIRAADLDGRVFQELIVLREFLNPQEKLNTVQQSANTSHLQCGLPANPSPHATHTVIPSVLKQVGQSVKPLSIHASETNLENHFFQSGDGPIAELYRELSVPFEAQHCSAIEHLFHNECLKPTTQLVHCCSISDSDIELMSNARVTVAHCPRSNSNLECSTAPIGKLRSKGVKVGIGLDSSASSGEIDYFEEMRSALHSSFVTEFPLNAEDVMQMATVDGAQSIFLERKWSIEAGGQPDLLLLNGTGIHSTTDLIEKGSPAIVCQLLRIRDMA